MLPALEATARRHAALITLASSRGEMERTRTAALPLYSPSETLERLKTLSDDETMAAGVMAQLRLAAKPDRAWNSVERDIVGRVARKKLPWRADDVGFLFDTAFRAGDHWSVSGLLLLPLAAAERCPAHGDVAPIAAAALTKLDALHQVSGPDRAKLRARLAGLAPSSDAGDDLPAVVLARDDNWAALVKARLLALPSRRGLVPVFEHLETATNGVLPTKKWLERCSQLVDAAPGARAAVRAALDAVLITPERRAVHDDYNFEFSVFLSARASYVVRGALWATALCDEEWATPLVAAVAMSCAISPHGGNSTRDDKVANAAVAQLGTLATPEAIAALAQLKAKVKNRGARTQIDRAIDAASRAKGVAPDELLESTVPTHGLGADGALTWSFGAQYSAAVAIVAGKATTTWESAGKPVRSIPAAVKHDYAEELAALRRTVKDIDRTTAAERARIEALFARDGRAWPVDVWGERYVRHPITGALAADLIWTARGAGGNVIATFLGRDAPRKDALPARTEIELWHPISVPPDEVASWRDKSTLLRIRQPFKQAFREVYALTPAEEETETYSNRYASHILRYQQAYALMRARGWGGNYLGYWDGGFDGLAHRSYDGTPYRAEFYFDLVESPDDGRASAELCSTDQVRFSRREGREWTNVRLRDVPRRVFSEAMRDVDLFVSVTSIAADPNWRDRGDNRFDAYWGTTSFGDLSESAYTRRDALRRLVPMLAFADRCTLEERFLVVRGNLRTYKIHYGSGNILMSPRDQYLCIVPARGAKKSGDKVFLPFEEDGLLSVIISKAAMLAADDHITDASILRQLR